MMKNDPPRLGIWIIGARGGVAVSTLVGLAALREGVTEETGLVTALDRFAHLPFADWDQFVVGGHEIRDSTLAEEAERLHRESRVFDSSSLAAAEALFAETEANLRPGAVWNVGPAIRQIAGQNVEEDADAQSAVARLQADLSDFESRLKLDAVVVVNLASTEPPLAESDWPQTWAETQELLSRKNCPLPASSLYAIAALQLGMPYINFTPSLGASPPGIDELARLKKTCHAGRDAKTGETLLKSVLAPMFADRNLEVMSWVGHNIFGNLDGQVLDDPSNKSAKVQSKDHLLERILNQSPQTLVSIEHIRSLGDWKTAWDHVHFRGFLGTPMILQLTWQGCDSLLAAPLVLDLVRFALVAQERGETGTLGFLASFFKSPLGGDSHRFADQMNALETWANPTR